jgi:hypothetical protein
MLQKFFQSIAEKTFSLLLSWWTNKKGSCSVDWRRDSGQNMNRDRRAYSL